MARGFCLGGALTTKYVLRLLLTASLDVTSVSAITGTRS
jgi:hypothetical protein